MDFLPLAIWMVGYSFCATYEERTHYQRGKDREWIKENCSPIQAKFFLMISLFLFILGLY